MASIFTPIGVSGLKQSGGVIQDEWLRDLQGTRGRKVIREMRDGDDTIGGILFAIENLIAQMDWRVDPFVEPGAESPTPEAEADAQFVDECLHDMSADWKMTLTEILTFLPFGFAPMELVYKRRQGSDVADGPSNYNDGKIGWRKWALRSQDTVEKWELDEAGGVQGLYQQNPSFGGRPPMIPIERLLLFRTTQAKGNPEGRSILRTSYNSWYLKHHIQRIEGIGIERDLAGLPDFGVPASYLSEGATAGEQAVVAALKAIATGIRNDEQMGLVRPIAYDDKGNELFPFRLVSTGGARQFDTNAIIERYSTAIATTVLADFIRLGHEGVGSFALADSKTTIFGYALGSFADRITGVINAHAIPRLLRINGMRTDAMPQLVHGDAESADLEKLANFVDKLAGKGLLTPDATLESHLREMAGLPPADEDEMPDIEEEEEPEPPPQQIVVAVPPPEPPEVP